MTYKSIANKSPYFDDFDESKNFHRILFRPEKAVQARELTQIGSIAQNQIAELADYTFEDGTAILDADVSVDFEKRYMEIQDTDNEGSTVNPDNFKGKDIEGQTSGAKAIVTEVDSDNYIFYFDYHSGSFEAGEEIITYDGQYDALIDTTSPTPFGQAIFAKLEPGVVFVNRHFVQVNNTQEIIVDGTDNQSHNLIGFTTSEEVVDSADDPSLLDPANNATNYNAPGAHRYKISVNLTSIDAGTSPIPDNFHKLVEVNNGSIIKQQQEVESSRLGDLLARRDHEQFGNYVINDFGIKTRTDPNDSSKVKVGLEQGLAYVYGYRHETESTVFITTDKPRTYEKANNENLFVDLGPSVDIDSISGGVFDLDSNETVSFYSNVDGGGTKIGEARIVALVPNNEGSYRAHFTGVEDISNLFSSVRSFVGNSTSVTANVTLEDDGYPELHDRNDKSYIVPTPNKALRNVILNETNYDATRSYLSVSKTASDDYKIASNDTKVTFYPSSQGGVIVLVNGDTGDEITNYSAVTQNSDSELIITVNDSPLPSSVDVVVKVYKNEINPRTKTLTETTDTKTTDSSGETTLNNVDIHQIKSITRTSDNTTINVDNVTLDNGQRDFYYDFGIVSGLGSSTEYEIVYDYFAHSGDGDYFSVNSYDSTLYESIPTYTTQDESETFELRDVLDFRRSINEFSGGFDKVYMKTNVTVDYNYYLPRVDKVYIDKNGQFGVKNGVPELEPDVPNDKSNTMTLYELEIPAYLFNTNDIQISKVHPDNYTMDEIGDIRDRVNTLERYSALTQLEQDTKDTKIYDEEGFDKTKNGILVDNFVGHAVSNVTHPEYRCSIDRNNQQLRAPFKEFNIDFENLEDDSTLISKNVRNHEHLVTLDYTTVSYIAQTYASESISVQPYNISHWSGSIELSPSIDNWRDTETAPDNTVNLGGQNNNWEELENAFGTQWNDWQDTWTGRRRRQGNWWSGEITQRQGQRRTGTRLDVETEQIRRNIGERVIDTSIIPFMRSRDVQFVASGMKPNAELLAFFDDEDVTSLCTPQGGSQGDPLVTDSEGNLTGTFALPNNSSQRFRTGTKVFKLTDRETNPETEATANYTANGLQQTRQDTVVSMNQPRFSRETVSQSRTVNRTVGTWERNRFGGDPLAETIRVTTEGGLFLQSVDLYFESKPEGNESKLPVHIWLVNTENGYPSEKEIPYSRVTKQHADVNISSDATVATTFTFPDPIFLEEGEEYALVVFSNSTQYRVWVSNKGDDDVTTGETINKQPYLGSFFQSQNQSTWTAKQDKDLKFEVRRCSFETVSNGTYDIVNEDIGNVVYEFETMMPNVDIITHEATNVDWQYQFRDYDASALIDVEMKNNIYFNERRNIEDISGQDKPLLFRGTLSSNSENLSPIIEKQRRSAILVQNDVIDEGTYWDAGAYVTKIVNLVNPSDDLRVIFDAKKPVGSELDVYFTTGEYYPRYVEVDSIEDSFVDKEVNIFYYNDSTTSPSNTMEKKTIATVTKAYIEDSVSPSEDRMQLKSIADVGVFDDPVNTNAEEIFMVVGEDAMDGQVVDDYDSNTTYNQGDYVIYNSEIWKSTSDNNNGNTPSTSSTDWELIDSARVESEVKTATTQNWRSMVMEDTPDPKLNPDKEFVEYSFVPQESVDDEFTAFSVKIQMKSADPANIPIVEAFRSLAVY